MIGQESTEFRWRKLIILPADDECGTLDFPKTTHDIEMVASDEIMMHGIQLGAAISLPPEFDESRCGGWAESPTDHEIGCGLELSIVCGNFQNVWANAQTCASTNKNQRRYAVGVLERNRHRNRAAHGVPTWDTLVDLHRIHPGDESVGIGMYSAFSFAWRFPVTGQIEPIYAFPIKTTKLGRPMQAIPTSAMD
jgi:hypothetical protein